MEQNFKVLFNNDNSENEIFKNFIFYLNQMKFLTNSMFARIFDKTIPLLCPFHQHHGNS